MINDTWNVRRGDRVVTYRVVRDRDRAEVLAELEALQMLAALPRGTLARALQIEDTVQKRIAELEPLVRAVEWGPNPGLPDMRKRVDIRDVVDAEEKAQNPTEEEDLIVEDSTGKVVGKGPAPGTAPAKRGPGRPPGKKKTHEQAARERSRGEK